MRIRKTLHIALLFTLSSVLVSKAQANGITSNGTGLWSSGATWVGGLTPTSVDSVTINAGDVVTVDISSATASTTTIYGKLFFSRAQSSQLMMVDGNLTVAPGGILDMGTLGNPINASTATLVLAYGQSAGQFGLTVQDGGNFIVYGAVKNPATKATATVGPGVTSFPVLDATGWQVGDLITIDSEAVTITALSGNTITSYSPGLVATHSGANIVYVNNLSRTVVIRSSGTNTGANTAYVQNLVQNATSFNVNYGEFAYLGANVTGEYGVDFESAVGSISSSTFRNGYIGLFLESSSNNTFIANNFYGQASIGVDLDFSANNNTFISNYSYGNVGDGFRLVLAHNNVLTSNASYVNGVTANGFYTASSNQNTFDSNVAVGNHEGFYLSGVNNLVKNNVAANNNDFGIYLVNASSFTLISNVVHNNVGHGIFASASVNLTSISNQAYANGYDGIYLFQNSNNSVLIGDSMYSNGISGLGVEGSFGNTCAACYIGYSTSVVSLQDATREVEVLPNASVSNVVLKNSQINPTPGIPGTVFNNAGMYVLNYSPTPGLVEAYGDFLVSGSTLSLDYANQLYVSGIAHLRSLLGGQAASNFTVNSTSDTTAVSQLVSIQFNGSNWVVSGSSTPGIVNIPPGGTASWPASNSQVNLTIGNAAASPGDRAEFALLAASHDSNVAKKFRMGPSATTASTWNNNSGRSRIQIDTTGGFHAVGQSATANPTLIDRQSGSGAYYTFVDSGVFTVQFASMTNMDENGIWLSGSGPFSINNSTFDFNGTGLASTSTLITLNNVTNSNRTLNDVTYGKSRLNGTNYNFAIFGSTTGLVWTNQAYSGALTGDVNERNDLSNVIQWSANIPPSSPAIGTVYLSSMTATWGAVGSLSGYTLEASTGAMPNSFAGNVSSVTNIGNATTLSFNPGTLLTNTTYFVRVGAIWSGTTTYANTTPPALATLAATPGTPSFSNVWSSSLTVSWSTAPNPGYTPYEISMSTNNFTTVLSTPIAFGMAFTANTTTFINLLPSTTYYVRVRAQNVNLIPTTFVVSGSTKTGAGGGGLAAPTGLIKTGATVSSIDWAWTLVSGATGYSVYVASAPNVLVGTAASTSWTDNGYPANVPLGRVIAAEGPSQHSLLSASATFYTLANLPTVPIPMNIGSSSFTVTWTTNSNPNYTPYQIELAPSPSFLVGVTTPVPFAANLTSGTTDILGLAPSTVYWVRLTARNKDNILTNPGPSASVTTKQNGTGSSSGSGLGTANLLPTSVPRGGVVSSTLTFTVPSGGMGSGGRLEVAAPLGWWPNTLQNNNPSQDGYVTATSTAGVAFNLFFASTAPVVSLSFSSGFLSAGTTIQVVISNIHPNCPTPGQTSVAWAVKSALGAADTLGDMTTQPSQTFAAGQAQWIGYNPWGPLTVVSGQTSQAITLQANDNCGQPALLGAPLTINLLGYLSGGASIDPTVVFSTMPSLVPPVTSVTMPSGSSSSTYYYQTSSSGTGLQIVGSYVSPVGGANQQVWRSVNVLANALTFNNVAVDNGIPASGQKTMTLSPDGSGVNNFAYIRFTPSDSTSQWHVAISSNGFQSMAYERWGAGDPLGSVNWDGRNYSFVNGTAAGGPQIVPNGTYNVKIEVLGLVSDTSSSITVNTAQISGNVTLGVSSTPVQGAQVNAQGMNTPGYSFTTTDANGNYTLYGLRSGFQYNLYATYVSTINQAVVTGQFTNVSAPASGKNFGLSTPGSIRVSAVIGSSVPFPVFGSVNIHSTNYSQNYWGNVRLLPGSTTSDNGDPFNPSTWTVMYVQPGSYVVHLQIPGFGANDVTVSASSDVVVNLLQKANVYGVITLPTPAVNNTWISVEGVVGSNNFPTVWGGTSFNIGQSSAVYAVYAVDPGAYTFRARVDGYVPLSTTTVVNSATDVGNPQTGGLDFTGFSQGGNITGSLSVTGDTSSQPNPYTLWISAFSPALGANVSTQVQLSTSASFSSTTYQINGVANNASYQVFPPYLAGFESNPSGPQTVTISGNTGSLTLALTQVTGRVMGSVNLGGATDYSNVHLSLQGPYSQEVDLSAAPYSLTHLGTGNYTLIATYKTTGAQTRTSFLLSNAQTFILNPDLSAPTFGVTGTVSVQNAFSLRDSSNSLVTINTITDLLNSATTQLLTIDAAASLGGPGTAAACSGGTTFTTTTVRVEAFPKNFNSFGNSNRNNFNNCFGVGQYKYGIVDSSGNYVIPGLTSGVWEVSIYPYFDNGQVPNAAATKQIITIVNSTITGVNFPLSNGYTVSGYISLPAGLTDTRTFSAQIMGPRGDLLQSAPVMITGANSGSYQFTGLPSGSYSLLIQDFGTYDSSLNRSVTKYVSKPVQFTIAGADLPTVNVTLSRASSIVGKLLLQGANPDGSAALTIISQNNQNLLPNNFRISANANPWIPGGFGQAQFGPSGGIFIDGNNQFHIDGLIAATYDVSFQQNSFGLSIQGAGSLNIASLTQGSVQVGESQTVDLGNITLIPGLSLSGTVKDQQGIGLANIPVQASPATKKNKNGNETIQVFTDAQGNFTLTGLTPAIKIYDIVVARRPGPNDQSAQPVPYGTISKLAVDVTQVPAPTLNFVLPAANAQLTGTVVTVDLGALSYPENDNAGFPAAAIYVRSQGSVDGDNPLGDVSATALDGKFSIPYIPAGTYDITIESLGYRPLKLTGIALTNITKALGTLTLQKGPSLQATLTKPDGSSVNTNDVKFAVAATADLGSIIFGQTSSDANTGNITSIKFSGFELTPKTYNVLLFDNQDNIISPPEGKSLVFTNNSDSISKTLTFQPSQPFAFTHILKSVSGTDVNITYYFSRPLRNRGDDQDPTLWFTGSTAVRLSGHSISGDRRQLSVTYTPAAGEQNAVITFNAHTVDIDPSTSVEFVLSKTITLLLGQKATAEGNINPALGGKVSLSDNQDPSNVSVPSNALLATSGSAADVSSSFAVTFTATTDASSIVSGALHHNAAQTLAPVMARGSAAYVSEAYQAMQKLVSMSGAASSSLNPLSSFYSVLLPAGLSHTLNQNATLTLNYDTAADPNSINVYFFNGSEYLIELNNRVIDTVNHTISVGVSHFSTFVVLENSQPVILVTGDAVSAPDISVFNFPNPFNLQSKTEVLRNDSSGSGSMTTLGTVIRYTIPAAKAGAAHIDIYNVVGEKVRSIDLGAPTADRYNYVDWDGKNDSGNNVASGVYIGILKVGGDKKIWKMAVIK